MSDEWKVMYNGTPAEKIAHLRKRIVELEATIAELKKERAGQVMFEVEAGTNEANLRAKLIELGWAPPELREAAQAALKDIELSGHGDCWQIACNLRAALTKDKEKQ